MECYEILVFNVKLFKCEIYIYKVEHTYFGFHLKMNIYSTYFPLKDEISIFEHSRWQLIKDDSLSWKLNSLNDNVTQPGSLSQNL